MLRRLLSLSLSLAVLGSAAITEPASGAVSRVPESELPSTVHLSTPDGGTDAFVAWPSGGGSAAAVIVVHEWWGLDAQIEEIARRFARQGYVAIVPDLYHGKVAEDPETAHELVRGLEDTRVMEELDAARSWLRGQPGRAKSRIGVVGFCVGGGIALRFALRGGDLAAAVMFYGAPETDPEKLAGLRTPLMGHFGGDDEGIGVDRVEAFRAALQKAGKKNELYVYTGAGHAFMHGGRPSYHPDAARVAWARTLAFFQKYLKG